MSTAGGEALAGVLAVMAQLERRMIGEPDGVATPRGGRWHLSTVKRILDSHRLDIEALDARDRAESEALLAVESFEAVVIARRPEWPYGQKSRYARWWCA